MWKTSRPISTPLITVAAARAGQRGLPRRPARAPGGPADLAPFIREPSLSDPAALAAITTRLRQTVRAWTPYRPLYLQPGRRDRHRRPRGQLGFRFLPCLAGRIPRLAARPLRQPRGAERRMGDAHAARWDAVTPITTTAAMARDGREFRALVRLQGVDGHRLRPRGPRRHRCRPRGRPAGARRDRGRTDRRLGRLRLREARRRRRCHGDLRCGRQPRDGAQLQPASSSCSRPRPRAARPRSAKSGKRRCAAQAG